MTGLRIGVKVLALYDEPFSPVNALSTFFLKYFQVALGDMKVLLVSSQPFFRVRGTPINILNLVRALSGAGHEVDLLCCPFGEDIGVPGLRLLRSPRVPGLRDVKVGPSAAKFPLDARILLVGGDPRHREALEQKARDLGVSARRVGERYGLARFNRQVREVYATLPKKGEHP